MFNTVLMKLTVLSSKHLHCSRLTLLSLFEIDIHYVSLLWCCWSAVEHQLWKRLVL